MKYDVAFTQMTEDKKYIYGDISNLGYEDIRVAVFEDKK